MCRTRTPDLDIKSFIEKLAKTGLQKVKSLIAKRFKIQALNNETRNFHAQLPYFCFAQIPKPQPVD